MKIFSCLLTQLFFFYLMSIFSYVYSMQETSSRSHNASKFSKESVPTENVALENSAAEYQITDLNNLPYELKLYISGFLPVNRQNIGVLVKNIYQLSQISQEWRNVLSKPDIWKIVFSKFFKNMLMEKTYKKTKDIQLLNGIFSKYIAVVESIKSSVVQKGLDKNIINAMSNVFYSILKEAKLNLSCMTH